MPDVKTVWWFRERLTALGLVEKLLERFHEQLAAPGYVARQGQMVDATFVEVLRLCPRREENAPIKAGEKPTGWEANQARQKDVDARWTKKNEETLYGYKNHLNADAAHQLLQDYVVTNAAVHDRQVIAQLLDYTPTEDGSQRPVYADSAYRAQDREQQLAKAELPSNIGAKGRRGHPLTAEQKQNNRNKSKVCARVEHIFGAQQHLGGHFVRTIGIARATTKIGLLNLVYHMKRLVQLLKRDANHKSTGGSPGGLAAVVA